MAAAMLIRDTRTGVVCDWSDVKAIEKVFLVCMKAEKGGAS